MRCIEYDYSHELVGSTSFFKYSLVVNSFHDRGPYHIENSPLICHTNQWAGFYMIGTSFIKELFRELVQMQLGKRQPLVSFKYLRETITKGIQIKFMV